ncbi:GAP family protein [Streptomyces sp. NBC_01340]|uniref:GAP family protein n=2 Tax=unclassified Streptomyces TaxID=2593676 RepID=UPI002255B9ED|nr:MULTISPECIES: GAP family protein [unclassified Streptomyces]MCX4589637.1 GAP family protein [Streptomyces sp. NBC_01549]WSI40729.1 GAP family protein [Streptomyces sp. NBC_01340]
MGQVLGDVLGLAAAVAVSPLPIIAMILVLATPRGRLNGILFTVGWILGLSVLGAAVLAIVGPRGSSSSSSTSSQPGGPVLRHGAEAARRRHLHPHSLTAPARPFSRVRTTCPGDTLLTARSGSPGGFADAEASFAMIDSSRGPL